MEEWKDAQRQAQGIKKYQQPVRIVKSRPGLRIRVCGQDPEGKPPQI